jgi:hypothetical protein
MTTVDIGIIKELIYGGLAAMVCFTAPSLIEYVLPEPTVIHGIVNEMPYLGFLVIGLTIIRLLQRKKHAEKES